ncbi:MAG: FAD-binding oxidoreductase, partial [Cyanobacteria bacterium J06606_4]
MNNTERILSDIPGNPLLGLQRADALWHAYKTGDRTVPSVVTDSADNLPTVEYDVVICGGTLGILLGAALSMRGWKVALLERGELRGRDQEWNISRRELETFVKMGLLSEAGLESAIASQYNPARIAFTGGDDLWVR